MTGRPYDHVLSFVLEHPWAVTPAMRTTIAGILARRIVGQDPDPATLQAALVNRRNLPQPAGGSVAVIPIYGVIAPRMNMLSEMSGGTTFEALTSQLHEAMANKAVKTIVFDVDSPGGSVAGASEFAREVLAARAKKPIIAQAQYLMASAAYWPMSCATQIWAAPSAHVGSIGVYTIHDDLTEAMAQLGVKQEVIAAGKYKAEAANSGALTDSQRGHIQATVDAAYERFLKDISKGRGVALEAVRNGFGEGRVVTASEALSLGMLDGVSTLTETLARVMTAAPAAHASHAALLSAPDATDQEPQPATSQEPPSTDHWQQQIALALLDL